MSGIDWPLVDPAADPGRVPIGCAAYRCTMLAGACGARWVASQKRPGDGCQRCPLGEHHAKLLMPRRKLEGGEAYAAGPVANSIHLHAQYSSRRKPTYRVGERYWRFTFVEERPRVAGGSVRVQCECGTVEERVLNQSRRLTATQCAACTRKNAAARDDKARARSSVQVGATIYRWTILAEAPGRDCRHVHVRCECGTTGIRQASAIALGKTRGCKACSWKSDEHTGERQIRGIRREGVANG